MWIPYFGRNLTFQSACVTLKIRSRSSNQFLTFSQQCIQSGLVKVYLLVQKIVSGNSCFYGLYMLVTLKVKVTKILLALFILPTMYLCKFGRNLSFGSEDNARKHSYAKRGYGRRPQQDPHRKQ